jgi:putative transposase
LSQPAGGHRIYPYLLEGLEISGSDQVWCSDITDVPMAYGFMYLVAVMDLLCQIPHPGQAELEDIGP